MSMWNKISELSTVSSSTSVILRSRQISPKSSNHTIPILVYHFYFVLRFNAVSIPICIDSSVNSCFFCFYVLGRSPVLFISRFAALLLWWWVRGVNLILKTPDHSVFFRIALDLNRTQVICTVHGVWTFIIYPSYCFFFIHEGLLKYSRSDPKGLGIFLLLMNLCWNISGPPPSSLVPYCK